MRSWLLAARIAAVFLVVMMIFVTMTLHRFAGLMWAAERQGISPMEAHDTFIVETLGLAVLAMLAMMAFAFWVTAPIRRMSRSMDRVAAGDLDHRVAVRGRDEAAAMGRSFNAMAERVRDMLVGQKELMAGVSHELRSPLTRMKLSIELLRQEHGEETPRIRDLEEEVDELDGLIEELLLISRLEFDAAGVEAEDCHLATLCDRAWRRVAEAAEQKGIALELEIDTAVELTRVDPTLVVRLLGNLFENSIRHTTEGRVTVAARVRDGRAGIVVTDDGPGVDPSDLDRLFEPFFRADRSRSRRTGAGGLGLMIVRRAVEAHDGQVSASNTGSRGLAVSFDLPLARGQAGQQG